MCCLAESSCQWLMLCSAESPTTSTLALYSPEARDNLLDLIRLMRQVTPQGHRLSPRLHVTQHVSPHAAAGCIPAWVSSMLTALVEAWPAARQLLAELLQAPPGTQQQQPAQAGFQLRLEGWTSQPYPTAAHGVQSAAAQMLASSRQSPARNRQGRKGKALTKPFPDLSSYSSVRQLYDAFTTDDASTGRIGLLKVDYQQASTGWRSGKGHWQRWSEQITFIAEIDRQAAALSKLGPQQCGGSSDY